MISEKIKVLRKQAKLSQEQLAEKLNVSRQAITKWETGVGIPEIDSLRRISKLFDVSLDELLETGLQNTSSIQEHIYNSYTEYDMECEKHYDIVFSGAKQVSVCCYEGEKIKVRLSSDVLDNLTALMKTKIDDIKKRIDIDIRRVNPVTEMDTKKALYITIWLPQQYTKNVELSGNTESLTLTQCEFDNFEFTGKVKKIELHDISGHIELNTNNDANIYCNCLNGRLDINQISATSTLYLPIATKFKAITRGIGNHILYYKENIPCNDFSLQGTEANSCENIIELNGMKSELVIQYYEKEI